MVIVVVVTITDIITLVWTSQLTEATKMQLAELSQAVCYMLAQLIDGLAKIWLSYNSSQL